MSSRINTLYALALPSATLASANQLTLSGANGGGVANPTGVASPTSSVVGASTGYVELLAQGGTPSVNASLPSTASGLGWFLDDLNVLAGTQLLAGNWTLNVALATSMAGKTATVTLTARAWLYDTSALTYTLLGTLTSAAGIVLTTTAQTIPLSGTITAAAPNSTQTLYVDLFADITATTLTSGAALIVAGQTNAVNQGLAGWQLFTAGNLDPLKRQADLRLPSVNLIRGETSPAPAGWWPLGDRNFRGLVWFNSQSTNRTTDPANANFRGILLIHHWSELNTASGVYNWTGGSFPQPTLTAPKTAALSSNILANVTALPVSSNGTAFTNGQTVVVGSGTPNVEVVTVNGTPTSTSVPCTATANTHSSGDGVAVVPTTSATLSSVTNPGDTGYGLDGELDLWSATGAIINPLPSGAVPHDIFLRVVAHTPWQANVTPWGWLPPYGASIPYWVLQGLQAVQAGNVGLENDGRSIICALWHDYFQQQLATFVTALAAHIENGPYQQFVRGISVQMGGGSETTPDSSGTTKSEQGGFIRSFATPWSPQVWQQAMQREVAAYAQAFVRTPLIVQVDETYQDQADDFAYLSSGVGANVTALPVNGEGSNFAVGATVAIGANTPQMELGVVASGGTFTSLKLAAATVNAHNAGDTITYLSSNGGVADRMGVQAQMVGNRAYVQFDSSEGNTNTNVSFGAWDRTPLIAEQGKPAAQTHIPWLSTLQNALNYGGPSHYVYGFASDEHADTTGAAAAINALVATPTTATDTRLDASGNGVTLTTQGKVCLCAALPGDTSLGSHFDGLTGAATAVPLSGGVPALPAAIANAFASGTWTIEAVCEPTLLPTPGGATSGAILAMIGDTNSGYALGILPGTAELGVWVSSNSGSGAGSVAPSGAGWIGSGITLPGAGGTVFSPDVVVSALAAGSSGAHGLPLHVAVESNAASAAPSGAGTFGTLTFYVNGTPLANIPYLPIPLTPAMGPGAVPLSPRITLGAGWSASAGAPFAYYCGRLWHVQCYGAGYTPARIAAHALALLGGYGSTFSAALTPSAPGPAPAAPATPSPYQYLKQQMVLVYKPDGATFLDVWTDAPLLAGFKEAINSAPQPLRVQLPRAFDDFDEGGVSGNIGTVAQGNIVKYYLYGPNLPATGLLRFQGVIDKYEPSIDQAGGESVTVTITPLGAAIGDSGIVGTLQMGSATATTSSTAVGSTGSHTITVASATGLVQGAYIPIDSGANLEYVTITTLSGTSLTATFAKTHSGTYNVGGGMDPCAMFTYFFTATDSYTGLSYTSPLTVDTSGSQLTSSTLTWYTWQDQGLDSIFNTILLMLRNDSPNWYWRINPSGTVTLNKTPTVTPAQNVFYIGQHLAVPQYAQDWMNLRNLILVVGNTPTISALAAGSDFATFRHRGDSVADTRITTDAQAQTLANGKLAAEDRVIYRGTYRVVDYRGDAQVGIGYDIETLQVGQSVQVIAPHGVQLSNVLTWDSGQTWDGGAVWGGSTTTIENQVAQIVAISYAFDYIDIEVGAFAPSADIALIQLAAAFDDFTIVP